MVACAAHLAEQQLQRSICVHTGCVQEQYLVQVTHILEALRAQQTVTVVIRVNYKEIDLKCKNTQLHSLCRQLD